MNEMKFLYNKSKAIKIVALLYWQPNKIELDRFEEKRVITGCTMWGGWGQYRVKLQELVVVSCHLLSDANYFNLMNMMAIDMTIFIHLIT